jgi:predicted  nucleic acid-binding Zn-ribbon protein
LGLFSWLFGSETMKIRDKIIFTQKHRITSLEKDVEGIRNELVKKDDELNRTRDGFERSKERLVEQIIQLSDKFAEINQRMLDIAHENARLKMIVDKGEKKPKEKKPRKKRKK